MNDTANLVRRKLARLAAMNPTEMAHRIREKWYGLRERRSSWSDRVTPESAGGTVSSERVLSVLRGPGGLASVLLPAESRASLSAAYREFFPGREDKLCEIADQICSGTVRLFGQAVSFPGGHIDWHIDWATGEHFPLDFYRKIRKLGAAQKSDLKRVWETNRQQFLVTLGQAYFLTGCERYAESALDQIDSWIEANPPYRGVNWIEALEVSLRLCSWIWTLALVADTPALTGKRGERILGSIQTQRVFIERHLSTYSSPNTHLLGEAMGLFLVGCALEQPADSGASVSRAKEILEAQLDRQLAPDGSHREQSAYYHAYATDMYLLSTVIGLRKGTNFSAEWTSRLQQMCEYLTALSCPNGALSRFGDDDGGRNLRLAEEDYYRPLSLHAIAASLFERGEFKSSSDIAPEEVFWLLGAQGVRRFLALPNRGDASRPAQFPDAGFSVLGSGPTPSRFWLACLGKPMGMMTAGHSHAAPLSFELCVDGMSIVTDPGTYSYQPTLPWRDFFRVGVSHNVLQLEGVEEFVPDGPFNWRDKDLLVPLPIVPASPNRLEMGYTGRDRSGRGYSHTRIFSFPSPVELRMEDQIGGSGSQRVRLWFHFTPECEVSPAGDDGFLVRRGHVELSISARAPVSLSGKIWKGSDDPIAGWHSPRYGTKIPAPALCLEGDVLLPATIAVDFRVCSIAPGRDSGGQTRIENSHKDQSKGTMACAES